VVLAVCGTNGRGASIFPPLPHVALATSNASKSFSLIQSTNKTNIQTDKWGGCLCLVYLVMWEGLFVCRSACLSIYLSAGLLTCSNTENPQQTIYFRSTALLLNIEAAAVGLGYWMTLMRVRSDPMCPLCQEEEETTLHLLGRCKAIY